VVASKKHLLEGATPRKSDKDYEGYLEDQNRKPFTPTAREEELLSKTVHPDEFRETIQNLVDLIAVERDRRETLEIRFNELLTMLHAQLANTGYLLLKIQEP